MDTPPRSSREATTPPWSDIPYMRDDRVLIGMEECGVAREWIGLWMHREVTRELA